MDYTKLMEYMSPFLQNSYLLTLTLFVISVFFAAVFGPVLLWLAEKLSANTKNEVDDKIFKIIKRPVLWSIGLLLFILLIQVYLSDPAVKKYGIKIALSVLILSWVHPLSRISALFLRAFSMSKRSFVKQTTLPLFINLSTILIWSLAVYFAFLIWGISLTAWLASAGIVGIAVGFAAKDTLANLISGIFILADAPYKVGDIIVLDSGEKGEVIHVGLRSTRIKTFDGVEITIPNANMGNSKIVNETGTHINKKVRLRVPVSISYNDSPEEAEKILLDIADSFDDVCKEPKAQVRFLAFGPSSLDMELRVWLEEPAHKGKALDKFNREILKRFREANIEIPYNKMDIYIKEHNSKDD